MARVKGKLGKMWVILRPNGLPLSRRERAGITCQNANDLVREAVGYSGVFGRRH
jgi:hypothetical protein